MSGYEYYDDDEYEYEDVDELSDEEAEALLEEIALERAVEMVHNRDAVREQDEYAFWEELAAIEESQGIQLTEGDYKRMTQWLEANPDKAENVTYEQAFKESRIDGPNASDDDRITALAEGIEAGQSEDEGGVEAPSGAEITPESQV